jgi:hypothetical protein
MPGKTKNAGCLPPTCLRKRERVQGGLDRTKLPPAKVYGAVVLRALLHWQEGNPLRLFRRGAPGIRYTDPA